MREKKFDEKIEKIYATLSETEKSTYIEKQNKLNKCFFVFGIILCIIALVVLVAFTAWLIIEKEYTMLAFADIITVALIIFGIGFTKSCHDGLVATDEIKVKNQIKRLEQQKAYKEKQKETALFRSASYRLSVDKIKSVSILDSYTEYSDKLHAVLNYQEIIQTRVYKFKVDYIDGNSKVITAAENSEEYNLLVPYINKNAEIEINSQNNDNIAKLREYKQLLDDGIITQEEFETKKKELL